MDALVLFAVALGSFIVGAIPFGVLIGRAFFGVDLRAEGSGNIGAANATRTFGRWGGLAVLVLDAFKGFAPTALELHLGTTDDGAVAALFAVLGHCYSPFLRMRGGKGVATWLGAALAFWPPAALAFGLAWVAIVLPTRFASLGSLVATALSALALAVYDRDHPSVAIVAVAVVAVVTFKHRENIARLRTGSERKLRFGGA